MAGFDASGSVSVERGAARHGRRRRAAEDARREMVDDLVPPREAIQELGGDAGRVRRPVDARIPEDVVRDRAIALEPLQAQPTRAELDPAGELLLRDGPRRVSLEREHGEEGQGLAQVVRETPEHDLQVGLIQGVQQGRPDRPAAAQRRQLVDDSHLLRVVRRHHRGDFL